MKIANKFFKLLTTTGLVLVLVIVLDYCLPAKQVSGLVIANKAVIEGGRKRVHTYNMIHIDNGYYFPVSKDLYKSIKKGDEVEIAISSLLDENLKMLHISSTISCFPVVGIYSFFSVSVALLLLSSLFGVLCWNNPIKHMNSIPFTIFLIGFVLFLVLYY